MGKTETRRTPQRIPREVARAIAAVEDKQAADVLLLDLRKAAGFADYFLICSGGNPRQIRAIADAVMEALATDDARPAHVEGYERSEWRLGTGGLNAHNRGSGPSRVVTASITSAAMASLARSPSMTAQLPAPAWRR